MIVHGVALLLLAVCVAGIAISNNTISEDYHDHNIYMNSGQSLQLHFASNFTELREQRSSVSWMATALVAPLRGMDQHSTVL